MTYRDFYTAVIADTENEELKAFATEAIAKLDARNASRASKPSKRSLENEPIKAKILEVLTSEPKVASEVAELVGISTQKASALLRQIDGLEVTEVKVPKRGKMKGYALAEQSEKISQNWEIFSWRILFRRITSKNYLTIFLKNVIILLSDRKRFPKIFRKKKGKKNG